MSIDNYSTNYVNIQSLFALIEQMWYDIHLMTVHERSKGDSDRTIEPLASPSANAAVLRYHEAVEFNAAAAERPDFLDHAKRVTCIVHAYASDLVAPEIYDVALMHDLVDRTHNHQHEERQAAAANELAEYFTGRHVGAKDYVAHVLADLSFVEESAETCRSMLPPVESQLASRIDTTPWSHEVPPIDIPHLADVAHRCNLEAIIVKAAEAIDNLIHKAPSERALLHDVTEAEHFYAPLCEVAGLDAMAMKLRSEATKRRFEQLSEHDLLARAGELHREAARFGIECELPSLLAADDIDFSYVPGMHLDGGEFSWFGSASVMGGPLDGASIRYRLKSIGSIARKLDSEPTGNPPLDTIAVTVITQDYAETGRTFRAAVDQARAHDRIELTPARTKSSPLYIQGSPSYVQAASHEFGPSEYQQGVYPDTSSTYNVAKYTARMRAQNGVYSGIEVQFVTETDRRRARIGETAHIIYKQQLAAGRSVDYSQLVELLGDMYDRKNHIDPNGVHVNKESVPRTHAMLASIWEIIDNQKLA